jgi:transcriptional regulator with XRE-family HTH domain
MPEKESKQIYDNIRTMRILKNISQEFMAEEMKVSQSSYGKLERGATKVTWEKLVKIAKIFQCGEFDIVHFKEKGFVIGHNADVTLSTARPAGYGAKSGLLGSTAGYNWQAELEGLKYQLQILKELAEAQKKTIAILEAKQD